MEFALRVKPNPKAQENNRRRRNMFRPSSSSLSIAFALLSTLQLSAALSCYSYDGFVYEDQQICPGSSQCCGVNATCTENRLCENQGERENTFVRGPCAVHPWDPAVCATICLYGELAPRRALADCLDKALDVSLRNNSLQLLASKCTARRVP